MGKAARVSAANSAALRKHFLALTSALLEPLLPFAEPGGGVVAGGTGPPSPLASFSHAAFLDSLARARIPPCLLERFPSQVSAPPLPLHTGTRTLARTFART